MNNCIKCGKEAIVKDSFSIGCKDAFSMVELEGAAIVGVCIECVKPYFKKQINKNLLIAIGTFAFGLFMLLTVVTNNFGSGASSSVNPIWFIAVTIAFLGGSIKYFLAYIVAMKKLSKNDISYIKEMTNIEVITKVLEDVGQISEDIILNWKVLNTKRGAVHSDFTNPSFIAEIRTPFKLGTNGKVVLGSVMNISNKRLYVLGYGTDKSLDEEGLELIKKAVECYQSKQI